MLMNQENERCAYPKHENTYVGLLKKWLIKTILDILGHLLIGHEVNKPKGFCCGCSGSNGLKWEAEVV